MDIEKMVIVTVEFAVVLDPNVSAQHEVDALSSGIGSLYENDGEPIMSLEMPAGSWRIVSVSPEQLSRDLDPCWETQDD